MTTKDKFHRACLATLELVIAVLYFIGFYADLSSIDLWQYWFALVFFWLLILLFAACVRMYSKHRVLARLGFVLLAVVVLPVFFHHH